MRVVLSLMGYSGVEPQTMTCLFEELLHMSRQQTPVMYRCIWDDADIGRSRSKVIKSFLETPEGQPPADVCVMIDHDITWRAGDVLHIAERAVQHNAVVGGMVSKRRLGEGIASVPTEDIELQWLGRDRLVPAKWVGGAFMAVPREIAVKIAGLPELQTWEMGLPFLQFIDPETKIYQSEDWALCQRARENGYKVYLSTYPVCGHIGKFTYTLETATSTLKQNNIGAIAAPPMTVPVQMTTSTLPAVTPEQLTPPPAPAEVVSGN